MKRMVLASCATLLVALAGCSATTSDADVSDLSTPSERVSESQTTTAPTRSSTSPTPTPATSVTASGIAQSLTCSNISAEDPPQGASPVPASAARCSLGVQGYIVLAYSSQANASAGLNQLREQAESTGETVILAAGMTWIVRPAEGTAVGKDMLKAAKAIGGKKKILP